MLLDECAVFRVERIGLQEDFGRTVAKTDIVKHGAHPEVCELDFVGAFCRASLRADGVALTADFSSNLIRDLGVAPGRRLDIALPPDRLRVFAA